METLYKQAEYLEEHGIEVLAVKERLRIVIVRRKDLEAANEMSIDPSITIASRA